MQFLMKKNRDRLTYHIVILLPKYDLKYQVESDLKDVKYLRFSKIWFNSALKKVVKKMLLLWTFNSKSKYRDRGIRMRVKL